MCYIHSRKRFACFKLLQGTPLSLGQQEELLTWVETNFYYFAHIVRRHHQHHEALTNTSSASVRTTRWLHTLMQISFTQQNSNNKNVYGLELIVTLVLYFFFLLQTLDSAILQDRKLKGILDLLTSHNN